jgi:transcriptional regulator with XRE-family HTH domain
MADTAARGARGRPRGVPLPGLRAARRRAFLTQAELAVRAGVGLSTILRLERGDIPAAFSTARKLADALGIAPDVLARPAVEGPAR